MPTYTWTLTREALADRVLMKCGRLAAGESADADDRALVVQALDSVLKNLAWRGYGWPKTTSSSSTITLTAATANVTLPTDFYSLNALNYVDASGQESPIEIIDFPTYKAIAKKTQAATYPLKGYVDNFNVLWVWPVQAANVSAKLYYQKIVEDSTANSATALDSPWMLGLVYGVAAEVGDEFGVPAQKMARFEGKWQQQLTLGVQNEAPPTPDRVLMDD